jgi:hypothetical protein
VEGDKIRARYERDGTITASGAHAGISKRLLSASTSPEPKRQAMGFGSAAVNESQPSKSNERPRTRASSETHAIQQSAVRSSKGEPEKPSLCEPTLPSPDIEPFSPPPLQMSAMPVSAAAGPLLAATSTPVAQVPPREKTRYVRAT